MMKPQNIGEHTHKNPDTEEAVVFAVAHHLARVRDADTTVELIIKQGCVFSYAMGNKEGTRKNTVERTLQLGQKADSVTEARTLGCCETTHDEVASHL